MSTKGKKELFEVLKPPFRYDDYGQYIFDSNNNMVVDVRAWGKLQYYENGEELQDSLGNMITDFLNESPNIK
ncbi:MAG: hypothetical protein ACOCZ5_01425 [bacterium]